MSRILATIFSLLILSSVFGQSAICDCCSSSLTYKSEEDDSLFNAAVIKQNKIRELIIRTTSKKMLVNGKDTVFEIVDKQYNEYIFKFKSKGYIDLSLL